MGKLLKLIVLMLLVLLIALVALSITALESKPLVVTNSGEQVDQAESVKTLMRQLSRSSRNRTHKQQIILSQDQLNSLVGFAQRARPNINGKVQITAQSTNILVSYTLPVNPIGRYVNIDVMLLPGPGVNVSHVKIGDLTIPGGMALNTLVKLANWYTNSDIASQFIQQVESVEMRFETMQLNVLPIGQFLKELNQIKGGVGGGSDQGMRLRTAYYLKQLSTLEVSKRITSQSLAKYIGPIFELAHKRSTDQTAHIENEAAIMALAVFAGHHRFANLIGDVQPIPGKVVLPYAKPNLKNRVDLNQHFIFSAAIKILSEQGFSTAIGEFKELMDRGQGGSGYSFVDLAADFAGVEFAISATSIQSARELQIILAGKTDENNFFPNIIGLPEGLSKARFEQTFKQVDSPQYLKMVEKINSRIAELPIHQTR